MPTSLSLDQHLRAIESAGLRLEWLAGEAGADAPVPTCPAWDVRALLAHHAMVHRWAAANVRGDDPAAVPNQTAIRDTVADLPAFFLEGHAALLEALRAAPADLEAMTFLKDAPPPREFWARRQAHETTIHMVDALAAKVGRRPAANDADIEPALAADGIDELLRGFFTRGRSKLYDGADFTVAVVADDVERQWVLRVGERLTVDPDGEGPGDDVAVTVSGTAVGLYLTLWNRGDEAREEGPVQVLDRWHATQRVSWR